MMANEWMDLAECARDGKAYRALPEIKRRHICRTACPVLSDCRVWKLATETSQNAEDIEPAAGMTAAQIAAAVRRRDGLPAVPSIVALSNLVDAQMELALAGVA